MQSQRSSAARAFCAAALVALATLAAGMAVAGAAVHYTYVPIYIPASRPAGPPPLDNKPGSAFVRCDGLPAHQTPAELAARIVVIMATAGLSGPGEMADARKRAHGDDGVAACVEALATEADPIRRVQLTLGEAAHQIEAGHFDAALTSAASVDALAGPRAGETAYRRGLRLSGLELQAAALVRLGRPEDAAKVALEMAGDEPWDVTVQGRAARFVDLSDDDGPERKAFFAHYGRLEPGALTDRARAQEWHGDWRGAAESLEGLIDVYRGFALAKPGPQPALRAKAALDRALAGDLAASEDLAAATRAELQDEIDSGLALSNQNVVAEATELLDLRQVVISLESGLTAQARTAFAARSLWLAAGPGVMAALTDRLRAGADVAQRTGALASDGATVRAEARRRAVAAMTSTGDPTKAEPWLWSAIRGYLTDDFYKSWDHGVWKTDKSPFLAKKTGKQTVAGDFLFVGPSNGPPAGEALLMHAALLARARGEPGFVIFPRRQYANGAWVRFGKSGDPGLPSVAWQDASEVISALSDRFPGR